MNNLNFRRINSGGLPTAIVSKITAFVITIMMLSGCGQNEETSPKAGPVDVEAVTVKETSQQQVTDLPGRIEPIRIAEVRARVAGIILSRKFEEGTDIKAGQILFQIDPAPFRAALSRAEGELSRANAALKETERVLTRYTKLVKIDAVSQQDFDTATSNREAAQAARQTALADVETAKLNLNYATVRAPISGRIGRALVTEGALVGQNEATPLATIQQIDSVYADFRQPVSDALKLREAIKSGHLTQEFEAGAPVSIIVEGTDEQRSGRVLFSDITVERGTGQVLLRGQLPNPDGLLMPGMYVRVQVSQGLNPKTIMVPQRAVHHGNSGQAYVMVVGKDNLVEMREVNTGFMHGSQWQITSGLKPGDQVITGGAANSGDKVNVKKADPQTAMTTASKSSVTQD